MQQTGLRKKKKNGIYLNIKSGKIVKSSKDANGKRYIKEEDHYDNLTGFVRELNCVDKTVSGTDYKELQITVDTPTLLDEDDPESVRYQRYTLTYNFEKPFSTGFLLALANADITKQLTIGVYLKKSNEPSVYKPPTYCALRYSDKKELIKWVDGFPEIELKEIEGEVHKSTKARRDFINKVYTELKDKLAEINVEQDVEYIGDTESDEDLGESL